MGIRMYLLDSVILIDHFNGIDKATKFIKKHHENIKVSVITRAETLVGISEEKMEKVNLFLEMFETLNITRETADLAAKMRKEFKWKLPDAFQAAIAQQHRLKLVTRNTKDFSEKNHFFVHVPYIM